MKMASFGAILAEAGPGSEADLSLVPPELANGPAPRPRPDRHVGPRPAAPATGEHAERTARPAPEVAPGPDPSTGGLCHAGHPPLLCRVGHAQGGGRRLRPGPPPRRPGGHPGP